jgi:predicted nuclease with TOPRIM domain
VKELEEKERMIRSQAEKIKELEGHLMRMREERDDLLRKFTKLQLTVSSPADSGAADDAR